MIIYALYLAALFLLLKDGIPWAGAVTSGSIKTRGARREVVRRAEDPDRFKRLVAQRFKGMAPGALCLAAAIGVTLWTTFGAIMAAA